MTDMYIAADATDALRAEIRAFFADTYPQDILARLRAGETLDRDDHLRSQAALAARGWGAPHWPAKHGGPDWTIAERRLFEAEYVRAGAPTVVPMGLIYVAPIIIAFGTPEQQHRWLPDILAGRSFWAQGYSEPHAGSDLAALTTRARRDGDNYVVTGMKTWTSLGFWADWIFCLVRTGEAERGGAGISFLCIAIDSPGVTVRPITAIDGRHHLAEVTFDAVRVPVSNLIGEEGQGWTYSKQLLSNERIWYAHVAEKRASLRQIRGLAAAMPEAASPDFRRRLAETEIAVTCLDGFVERALLGDGGDVASLIKILATETAQAITELWLDLAGGLAAPSMPERGGGWATALPDLPSFIVPAVEDYLMTRAQTIYGGTTEVQKTIIYRALMAS
jgi:alkylation response protein AidB-like acyl-CoA dehydrogenase